MDSKIARNLVSRLVQTTKKPAPGPVSLSAEDAKSLHDVATEIMRREKEGIRSYWGARVADMNDLCEIILSEEQLQGKGLRKAEIAEAILNAVSQAEQSSTSAAQGKTLPEAEAPPKKRKKISPAEEEFLQQQLLKFRAKNASSAAPWGRYLQPKVPATSEQKSLS